MSDLAVVYVLTFSSDSIHFNDGDLGGFDDYHFLTDVKGLDGSPIRTPQWDAPQAPGGLPGKFRKGARHVFFEGEYLVQSTRVEDQIQAIRNDLDEDLYALLEDHVGVAGTLAWTPLGKAARSLAVLYEGGFDTTGVEQKTFTFQLYAANPDPT